MKTKREIEAKIARLQERASRLSGHSDMRETIEAQIDILRWTIRSY